MEKSEWMQESSQPRTRNSEETPVLLPRVSRYINGLSSFWGYVSIVFAVIMMLLIVLDVILRFAFNAPLIFVEEISGYLLVGIVFLGAAYTLQVDGHIHIDIVVRLLSKRAQLIFGAVISVLGLLYLCAVTWHSFGMIMSSYQVGAASWTILVTPLWMPQLLIPIGLMVFCIQAILEVTQNFGRVWRLYS